MKGITADSGKETEGKAPRSKASSAAPLILTQRDREIVRWVYGTRLATREQIQGLLFGGRSRSRCQYRLTQLHRHRYLDKLDGGAANVPDVYCVTRRSFRGARLLRAMGEDEPLDLSPVSPERVPHLLDISSCRIQFIRACSAPGFELLAWLGEEDLALVKGQHGILPDAYLQVKRLGAAEERRSAFFLEVERSGKAERLWHERLRRYGEFYYSGRFEEQFGTKALRVLVLIGRDYGIVPERRVAKLTALAEETQVTFFRFAPLDDFVSLPAHNVLAAPIWRRPGSADLVSLIPQEG